MWRLDHVRLLLDITTPGRRLWFFLTHRLLILYLRSRRALFQPGISGCVPVSPEKRFLLKSSGQRSFVVERSGERQGRGRRRGHDPAVQPRDDRLGSHRVTGQPEVGSVLKRHEQHDRVRPDRRQSRDRFDRLDQPAAPIAPVDRHLVVTLDLRRFQIAAPCGKQETRSRVFFPASGFLHILKRGVSCTRTVSKQGAGVT